MPMHWRKRLSSSTSSSSLVHSPGSSPPPSPGSSPAFTRTILVFGPERAGKSALITTYANGLYPAQSEPYCPTMYEEVFHDTWSGGERVNLRIIDTGGSDNFVMLRQLACREADILLLCFSIADPASLNRLPILWDEAKKQIHAKLSSSSSSSPSSSPSMMRRLGFRRRSSSSSSPSSSISHHDLPLLLLVGCQSDQQSHLSSPLVTRVEAEAMASALGAARYIESSALADLGVREVFDTALKLDWARRERSHWFPPTRLSRPQAPSSSSSKESSKSPSQSTKEQRRRSKVVEKVVIHHHPEKPPSCHPRRSHRSWWRFSSIKE
ncbi:MAG: P-loop containing nucleoside triphosphate hydrolase protein [Piptocephalis tieghemiana]|nr:MAG: P-loop containing nucleoside triphosphate hydrolase protein [Piptocephalis tieghemiana]